MATIIPESNNNNSSFDVVCRTAPQKKNYDNLQFKISNTIRYIDEGLWENRIQKIADTSLSTSANSERSSSSDSHESLDHICTHEIKRRNPSGFKIGGVKGFIESLIQGLFDKMKLNQTFSYFTDSAIKKYKQQIAHSITNRHDLKSVIKIQHPELREQLGIVDDNQLATTHVLQKNSPVNGQSYLDESGNRIDVTQGISSSSDRKVENTGNLRRIAAAATDSSICYTGRVETKNKALEQASFIFLSELKASRSGITPPTDENEIYSLDYVVSSVMTANLVMAAKIPKICPVAEREMIYDEKQVLEELSTMEFVEITDPETGTVYKVKLNPIMFSDPFNAFHKFEYTLSEDISGVDI
ncbi:MAG: hypothetical protein FJZ57_01415, partial [Chlamydiae bacterium]|nr:hypothetical protein [Chlamydiota bacterium]